MFWQYLLRSSLRECAAWLPHFRVASSFCLDWSRLSMPLPPESVMRLLSDNDKRSSIFVSCNLSWFSISEVQTSLFLSPYHSTYQVLRIISFYSTESFGSDSRIDIFASRGSFWSYRSERCVRISSMARFGYVDFNTKKTTSLNWIGCWYIQALQVLNFSNEVDANPEFPCQDLDFGALHESFKSLSLLRISLLDASLSHCSINSLIVPSEARSIELILRVSLHFRVIARSLCSESNCLLNSNAT